VPPRAVSRVLPPRDSELPSLANLLSEHEEPISWKLRTETCAESFAADRKLSVEPNETKLSSDVAPPKRVVLLIEIDDPKLDQFNTDISRQLPNEPTPTALIPLLHRLKLRKESALARFAKVNMLTTEPNLPTLLTEQAEPMLARSNIDSEDTRRMLFPFATETPEPRRIVERRLKELPNVANAVTDIPPPTRESWRTLIVEPS
jgi:hypothetical protein